MKIVSNKFRNSLRGVRQLGAIIGYYSPDGHYILATENKEDVLTEDELELITETGTILYNNETINSVNPVFNSTLFKTTCKSVQIDCVNRIEAGTKINVRIGVYIPDDDEVEYVNYGDYYVIDEPVYQADTKSYLITAYDKMVQSMVDYDSNPLNITYPINHKGLVTAICHKLGWQEELINYPNYDKLITKDIYHDQGLTYRDILDDLNSGCAGSFMFSLDNQLIYKRPTETGLIIEDDDLKDTDVDFGKKYGELNSLTIVTKEDIEYPIKDDESITENGETKIVIEANYLLNEYPNEYINGLFNELDGLEYNLFDVNSTGLLVLEPLDIVTFRHNNVNYKTIIFNDDIKLSQGLEESLYSEILEENSEKYEATNKDKLWKKNTEKKVNDALVKVDTANAEIILKVNSDGKIAQVRLDADADTGTVFEIDAETIGINASQILNLLAGNEINLTSKNINIASTNFNVDSQGNLSCRNATLNDGILILKDLATSFETLRIDKQYHSDGNYYTGKITLRSALGGEVDIRSDAIEVIGSDASSWTWINGGNIQCDNLSVTGSKNRLVALDNKKGVLLNAYETATPYFGDIGSNITDDSGICKIQIEEIFKQTIEPNDYKVFIQKCSPGNLYVKKYNDYFEVIGTPNTEFDWELKAIQKGYKDVRLKEMEMRRNGSNKD